MRSHLVRPLRLICMVGSTTLVTDSLPFGNRFACSRMAGDAIDWSYATAGIEWSYSAELRDTGTVSVCFH